MKKFHTGLKRNRKAQKRRQEEATLRMIDSNSRSIAQRIERLDKGGFAASREREKLAAMEA
jgi:hypothetical protein